MLNRRKFLKRGILATIGSFLFPKLIFPKDDETTILDYKPIPEEWTSSDINIAWIGHSTVLINPFRITLKY